MKRIITAIVATAAVAAGFAGSAQADYWCGTPHGTVVVNSLSCSFARDITDKAYDVGIRGNQTGFMVDGYGIECYKNYSGGWYILCVPEYVNGYVYWYI
jgi:hypothetical protein